MRVEVIPDLDHGLGVAGQRDEVTERVRTTDLLMSQWFVEFQYPHLYQPEATGETDAWRPSWMQPQEVVA